MCWLVAGEASRHILRPQYFIEPLEAEIPPWRAAQRFDMRKNLGKG